MFEIFYAVVGLFFAAYLAVAWWWNTWAILTIARKLFRRRQTVKIVWEAPLTDERRSAIMAEIKEVGKIDFSNHPPAYQELVTDDRHCPNCGGIKWEQDSQCPNCGAW